MNPWSVQLELVEGCNRICDFCGLNAIRERVGNYEYMTIGTLRSVALSLARWVPRIRIEFAMHGEPLMHPEAPEFIRALRSYVPKAQIQLTTNGRQLLKETLRKTFILFEAGCDFLVVDTYEPEAEHVREAIRSLHPGVAILDFYDDCVPRGISPWHNHRRKLSNTIILMDDLGKRDGEVKSRTIQNHAGNTPHHVKPTLSEPLAKKCTLPFREITVAWNGNVNHCCHDWGHEYVCGNVNEATLEEIWNGPAFVAVRRKLYAKQRDFTPCSRCDYSGGGRMGLLEPQDPPTSADEATIAGVHLESVPTNGRKPWRGWSEGGF